MRGVGDRVFTAIVDAPWAEEGTSMPAINCLVAILLALGLGLSALGCEQKGAAQKAGEKVR
jgi:hypothetical protein